jgi:DNA-binding response OmpR family regulator
MSDKLKAVAFDVDAESLASLREAFPDWEIQTIAGATTGSIRRDWSPDTADLLIVGARDQMAGTLGLCRGLRSQAGRTNTPLLVLVPPDQNALVKAALEAGADSCLVLPVHAKDLISMVKRAREANQPGRHTLNLDHAQREDQWRDAGGEA